MEIQTAPVQPAGDRQRETAPRGFLVAGRLWNRDYIDELSILTESTIAITLLKDAQESFESNYTYNFRTGTFSFSRIFYGWNKNPLLRVSVKSESPMLKEFNLMTTRQMGLFAVFASAIIISIFYFLLRWVNIPLAMISRSLKSEDPQIIHSLEQKPNEFGNLARLIVTFFHQKSEPVKEVRSQNAQRRPSLNQTRRSWLLLKLRRWPLFPLLQSRRLRCGTRRQSACRLEGRRSAGGPLPFVPPDKQRDVQGMIDRVIQGNSFTDFEIRCNRRDGSPIDLTISAAPLRDATGAVGGIMAVIHDTTVNRQLIREIIEISGREQIRNRPGPP